MTLQWATYYDAADQAGISRLHMGIHISQDDFEGRIIGAEVGTAAWALAQQYFDGTRHTLSRVGGASSGRRSFVGTGAEV